MEFKCSITQMATDWTEVMTMEEAEAHFGKELALVLNGRHDRFIGTMVHEDTPLGYVDEKPCPPEVPPHMVKYFC